MLNDHDLSEYAYLWDGSAPEWILMNLRGRLMPFNTATGRSLVILDGNDEMSRVVTWMQASECPVVDFIDWKSENSSLQEVVQFIRNIEKRVLRIKTHTTRAIGGRAEEIAAPIKSIRASLDKADMNNIAEISRQLWNIHFAILDLETQAT